MSVLDASAHPAPLSTRAELKALGLLTAPILASQLAQASYGFIDTLMASQVSALDLAAVAVGSGIWLPLFLFITGILLATTPLVAEAYGANQRQRIAGITHQAMWLALGVGVIGFIIVRHAYPLFEWLGVPPQLREMTQRYLLGVSWGMPAVGLFFALRCYCEAQDQPVPVMIISVSGLSLNVAFNTLFIHGSESISWLAWLPVHIPAMGGPGCGWATSVVLWLMSGIMLGYLLLSRRFQHARLMQAWEAPKWSEIKTIAALGLPIGLAIFFEVSTFALVAVLVSPQGVLAVAGHQVALSLTSFLFMVPLSMAIALTIRVGQFYGARDFAAILHVRRVGLIITTCIAASMALILLFGRHAITEIYTDDAAVRALAAQLLLFAVFYQIVDALQVAAAGCLRGLQDTKSPMRLTLFAYWGVAIPVGYLAGSTTFFGGQSWGPHGYWLGIVLGLTVASILLMWQLGRTLNAVKARWQIA
ncbi:MAG: MATE family efflux transporter [Paraperlucidibaca sp.]